MVAAARRYLRMLVMAEDPSNDFYFSPIHVIDYCLFGEKLKHFETGMWELTQVNPDGSLNDHIILQPWQIWVESAIHGFRRRFNGTRLVTTALEMVPRKNAKSLKAVIAALFDLCVSGQRGPEIPIAASTKNQADETLFGDITKMVNNDKDLVERYGLKVTRDQVTRGDGAIFPVSSQGERLDGLNPSLALFEEGHAGGADVYKVIDSAFGARPNALRRMITTAGYRPEGPAFELVKQAEMILLNGVENYEFFAAIYTLDRELYTDPETNAINWRKLLTDETLIQRANPMYGISLDPSKIKTATREGLDERPDKRGEIARTRFNIWTGAGMTLIDASQWAACTRKITIDQFFGEKCWLGVDLAQINDCCAITAIFELPGDVLAVFCKAFLPELSPTVSHPELVDNLSLWAQQGHLVVTPGPLADHDMVRQEVEVMCDLFDVQVIACDPHQAHNTVKYFWDNDRPVMVYTNNQGTMTPPTDDLIGRVMTQRVIHDGNPMLSWFVQNVHGERKGNGLILPRKEKEGSPRKIDGFVAMCFANGCRMDSGVAKDNRTKVEVDPYLNRGIIGFDGMINGRT